MELVKFSYKIENDYFKNSMKFPDETLYFVKQCESNRKIN